MIYYKMPASKNSKAKSKTVSRRKKTTTETTTEAAAVVEQAAPVVEAAPVVDATPAVVETSTELSTETPIDENSWEYLDIQFKAVLSELAEWRNTVTQMQSHVRKLQKTVHRSLKENSKRNRKRAASADKPKRAPSGFAKPALISDDLCSFLNVEKGTEMARTEVTKHLTQYIKDNSLQDEVNRRRILVDEKLGQLLGVTEQDEVTYFNLQKYMKVHFPKSQSQTASA